MVLVVLHGKMKTKEIPRDIGVNITIGVSKVN